jgi:type IV pilus assembly protein PilB
MIAKHSKSIFESIKSASVTIAVDALVEDAVLAHASDVHIDPAKDMIHVRFRVDGVLQHALSFSVSVHPEIVARLKIISHLRIDEQKIPQDGRFSFSKENSRADVRISIIPSMYGESIVLRILPFKDKIPTLPELGFPETSCKILSDALNQSSGMILVTGPTGSGKSTTLYSLLSMKDNKENSIVSIEDPVEYSLSGIKQIQTRERVGLTFANCLRAVLRQDPDVIMVGEIRDKETASIATHASLTGHLLLSTLHTNDAVGAIPRLIDLEVLPFLVAGTLKVVVAQRLARRLCDKCKKEVRPDLVQKEFIKKKFNELNKKINQDKQELNTIYTPVGCPDCFLGFKGRVVVSEILVIDDFIRDGIIGKHSLHNLKNTATELGFLSMEAEAFRLVKDGITSLEETIEI